jgi:hypothetical protein
MHTRVGNMAQMYVPRHRIRGLTPQQLETAIIDETLSPR